MAPRISSQADRLHVFYQAHRTHAHLRLKDHAGNRKIDFMTLSRYADTDVAMMSVLIFDFLVVHIFSSAAVYGDESLGEALEFLQMFEALILRDPDVTNRKFWGISGHLSMSKCSSFFQS